MTLVDDAVELFGEVNTTPACWWTRKDGSHEVFHWMVTAGDHTLGRVSRTADRFFINEDYDHERGYDSLDAAVLALRGIA